MKLSGARFRIGSGTVQPAPTRRHARSAVAQMEARAKVGYPTRHRLSILGLRRYLAVTPSWKLRKRYHFIDGSAFALFLSRIAQLLPGQYITTISTSIPLNSNGHANDLKEKSQ